MSTDVDSASRRDANPSTTSSVLGKKDSSRIGRGGRILLVDGEAGVRSFLSGLLGGTGFDVTSTATGTGALALLEAHQFDVVVADLAVPDVTGEEVMRAAKQMDPECLVAVTGEYTAADEAIRLIGLGAADYIIRPLNVDVFIVTLAKLVAMRRMRKPPPSAQRSADDYVEDLLDVEDSEPEPVSDQAEPASERVPVEVSLPTGPPLETYEPEHDAVTGVLGSDDFTARLDEELGRSEMRGHACTLLLAAIDDFEDFDLRRDGASDEALRWVAQSLRKVSRPGDTLGRTSQNELAAFLPETGIAEARTLAEALLSNVEWYFTVSVGLACFPAHGVTVDDLMRNGRAALSKVVRRGGRAVAHLDDVLSGVRGGRALL